MVDKGYSPYVLSHLFTSSPHLRGRLFKQSSAAVPKNRGLDYLRVTESFIGTFVFEKCQEGRKLKVEGLSFNLINPLLRKTVFWVRPRGNNGAMEVCGVFSAVSARTQS